MKGIFSQPFYQPATKSGEAPEDTCAINVEAKIAAVADGVSEPYNSQRLRKDYGGGMTGGQMAGYELKKAIEEAAPDADLCHIILEANENILQRHLAVGLDPMKVAVGGACVAACQIKNDRIVIITIGDAWANYLDAFGWNFRTNIDHSAYNLEERGNDVFDSFKHLTHGRIGEAWVHYYHYMCLQQYFRANRNPSNGGHGMLNGNPMVESFWSMALVHSSTTPCRIVLGTDGMIPAKLTDPRRREDLAMMLGCQILTGGAEGVYKWAGSYDAEPHIGQGNRPEATMLQVTIEY